ncbi:MAG: flagellar basal body L-ring protein FlgH [Candidatus Scalindua sp. AMX11]|nr:MAG: flagellar basal body L-ring protein FlgH [Candidatus Scalindua sp.]NOG85812.1 flagellar basal body L-ring protein FlgH [Planctomycetota bacterium]RZV97014.1 MAG: flagellar basal body L-ring protein FlgH [Candidatus Scalindua sp. SCAELEC01]TDE66374.1 MAG: flagellar basal body L-ring protein FlgH [Candidatus Scalindua sp. AMX11]GJQ58235.1 MAG: flagellar L-ring protein [Candidatus Scalindua sp.]
MSQIWYIFIFSSVLNIVFVFVGNSISADSLWERRTTINYNLFDDNRGKRVGDIVTVMVIEETNIDNEEDASTDNSARYSGEVDNNAFVDGIISGLTKGRNARFDSRAANNVSGNIATNFSGKGSYDSTRKINLRITAMIVEVLDNGNLVLEGKRNVDVNREHYNLRLTGIARPIDISPSNTILSSQMSNVNFGLQGKGWLTRAGKKGWFNRFQDIFWPF